MSTNPTDERISVTADGDKVAVTLTLGDVTISVRLPQPVGYASMAADKSRAIALGNARRALEMARTELE